MNRFRVFDLGHLAALATIAGAAVLGARHVRKHGGLDRRARVLIAVAVMMAMAALMALDAAHGVSWRSYVPLQLCDAAVFLAAAALVSESQLAFELTYFWGGAGTLPALFTPDVAEGFPHWRFLLYFAQHGGIVIAAVLLAASGMRPRRNAPWIALAWLNGYAAFVGLVNYASGANFMYLCRKPGAATLLDWLGPWPWYLAVSEAVALAFFWLLALPFQPAEKSIG